MTYLQETKNPPKPNQEVKKMYRGGVARVPASRPTAPPLCFRECAGRARDTKGAGMRARRAHKHDLKAILFSYSLIRYNYKYICG